ncbi:MAG: HAMP domain-containing histidine kinase [Bacteroidetes bacterium]|nr:HAMP domain-containing histidine kinase [Bacteroidota bacterium]
MSGGPATANIKMALIFAALLIAAGTLYYTHTIVQKLQARERQIVQLYANTLEYIANSEDNTDLTFLLENIIQPIDFEVILSDAKDNVDMSGAQNFRNVKMDSTLSKEKLQKFFRDKIISMDDANSPILVKHVMGTDTLVLNKIHFGESTLVTQLRFFPYVQMLIAFLFIITAYIGFSQIKRSEQSNIWVGMAKETAHQFGTPLTSLMGWIELLKLNYSDPDKVLDTAEEINNDVHKLSRITNRFSKIGSKAELKKENVKDSLTEIYEYFSRRLPRLGKKVDLVLQGDDKAEAFINKELFGWVIENLIKNALDAIDHSTGRIVVNVVQVKNKIEIDVTDNGKGIDLKRRKDVFRPGYSTKTRGWGLGLSLSKRIIEEYHAGKIFVSNSIPGEGTTFKIILNKAGNS